MLLDASDRLVSSVSSNFKRYMSNQIDWQQTMSCVKGPKGTGKTTLILQHIKETFGAGSDKAVYVALDHIFFSDHKPIDVIDYFYTHGYTHLFIDEVHHVQDWSQLMKTVADFYPGLTVVYSGSSILKLSAGQADLSRRQVVYELKGLSFREFLSYERIADLPVLSLDDFIVDDGPLFEIGGDGKGFGQIKDVKDSYVVNDGVETGIGNKIPLWLFGFLY